MVREVFSRTIILANGCIAADGPSTTLLADGPLLEQYGLV
jgi:hypothetical protein